MYFGRILFYFGFFSQKSTFQTILNLLICISKKYIHFWLVKCFTDGFTEKNVFFIDAFPYEITIFIDMISFAVSILSPLSQSPFTNQYKSPISTHQYVCIALLTNRTTRAILPGDKISPHSQSVKLFSIILSQLFYHVGCSEYGSKLITHIIDKLDLQAQS